MDLLDYALAGSGSERATLLNVAASIFFGICLPLILSQICGISVPLTCSLVVSTFTIEYGAAAIGLASGLPPGYVLIVMASSAFSVILFSFSVLDALGERSPRVAAFIERAQRKYGSSRMLRRYGLIALVPGVMTVGLYVCPPLIWILGWNRRQSILLMMLGFLASVAATLLTAMGVLTVLPGT
ncbi:MAG: hypothetical protein QMD46_08985 [Methanomicrobiales archaeon]|nr:hypothetical protein [Methanomicrobiales archaeon]MDI6875502.1 hypothetical protein [Methanomicrobiales archaeon]